jgi:hypothetical protein
MSASIWIEVTEPVTDELVHNFRNFGEDVYRALKDVCCVSLNEIDRCENAFGVWDIPDHAMPGVRDTIGRLLREYGFHESARLSMRDGPGPCWEPTVP